MIKHFELSAILVFLALGCGEGGGGNADDSGVTTETIEQIDSGTESGLEETGDPCSDPTVNNEQDLKQLAECTSISGNLTISESSRNLVNLDGLTNIRTVEGNVFLKAPNLTSIEGLSGLQTIEGALSIQSSTLASLEGLHNLESIGSHLYIVGCSHLIDLQGLRNLTSVGEDLTIMENPIVTDLKGLDNLTSLGGHLEILDTPKVSTCEAIELQERFNLSSDDKSSNICGTLADECGGVACPYTT